MNEMRPVWLKMKWLHLCIITTDSWWRKKCKKIWPYSCARFPEHSVPNFKNAPKKCKSYLILGIPLLSSASWAFADNVMLTYRIAPWTPSACTVCTLLFRFNSKVFFNWLNFAWRITWMDRGWYLGLQLWSSSFQLISIYPSIFSNAYLIPGSGGQAASLSHEYPRLHHNTSSQKVARRSF